MNPIAIRKREIRDGVKSSGKVVSLRQGDNGADPNKTDAGKLARLIGAYAPHDGTFDLPIPGLHASRFSRVNKECVHALSVSSLCIVPQGAKTVIVGDEVFEYDASRMIVFSVALPVAAQVTRASQSEPYLSMRLDLDPHKIAELVLKVFPHGLPPVQERSAVYLAAIDASIVDAATRLMECLGKPGDAELLAPLVMDEILIRLLRGPIGVRVAQMGFAESSVHRVAKAISWLRDNFSQPMKVEDLAEMVHMSVSSFHEHFKSVTSMSPLHYQKVLRLQEARRLMLSTIMDAGAASQRVGYLSASQFSREYSRFFGNAPTRDIAKLRQEAGAWA
jgi:AraC-like DNA-binding protein